MNYVHLQLKWNLKNKISHIKLYKIECPVLSYCVKVSKVKKIKHELPEVHADFLPLTSGICNPSLNII